MCREPLSPRVPFLVAMLPLLLFPRGGSAGERGLDSALVLRDGRHFVQAAVVLESLAVTQPNDPRVLGLLSDTHQRAGNLRPAIEAARRALVLDPCQRDAHLVIGREGVPLEGRLCGANPDSAWVHQRQAVACDPRNAEAWYLISRSAARRGETDLEREALGRALQTGFWNAGAVAYCRWLLGDTPERAVLLVDSEPIERLCLAIQAAQMFRTDVVTVHVVRLVEPDYRQRLERQFGLSFMPDYDWDLSSPGDAANSLLPSIRQVQRWLQRSDHDPTQRSLAVPCALSDWSDPLEPSLVRRAACWALLPKSRAQRAGEARVDTGAVRAGLAAIEVTKLAKSIGWGGGPLDVDEQNIRAQAVASAAMLAALRRAQGRIEEAEWCMRRVADLGAVLAADSAASAWLVAVDQRWRRGAGEFPPWLVDGPREVRKRGLAGYVYVEVLPEAVTKVPPEYPAAARASGVSGTVVVKALVGKEGQVTDCCVSRSIPLLDAAALAAVAQWRFKPALASGRPAAVWVMIPVRFTLN